MELLNGFVLDCEARGLTKHTIQTYRSNVKTFLSAFSEPDKASLEELRTFLGDLRSRGLDGSTLKGYFAAISALYNYLIFEGLHNSNPVPSFRKRYLSRLKLQHNGENTRQLISIQDMQFMLSAAPGILERALLLTLAKTGMRRGELLSLRIDDIDLRRRVIRIPAKAKRSNRLVFMDDELERALREYISWRPRDKREKLDRLFKLRKDDPNRIIAGVATPLGFHDPHGPLCQKFTAHCFRHWFTTWLFRAGMDPQHIKWLRGDSLSTEAWQIYNHIDPEEVREQYLKRIPQLMSFDQKLTVFAERA